MRRRQYLSGVAGVSALSVLSISSAGADTGQASSLAAQTEGTMTITDPEGDDVGPGTYTYPANLEKGQFDVTQLDLEEADSHWEFTAYVGVQKNQFGNEAGFSSQVIQLYLQDPNAPDDAPTSTEGTAGVVSQFQEPYHYVAHIEAGNARIENANGDVVEEISASGNAANSTITFSIPKSPINTDDITQLKTAILVFSQDGFGENGIRQGFNAGSAGDWNFGGAKNGAVDSAPRVIDLVGPDTVLDQEAALSYSEGSPPQIPIYTIQTLVTGEDPTGGISAVAAPVGDVWATLDGTLDGTDSEAEEDVDLAYQWEQTGGGPEVEITDPSAAETTFTAPDVQEETTLEFTLTVSDPDDNEATSTTTATIKPQSANEAPVADAGEDKTASPGDVVSLQSVDSEDPNGGTLSYEWSQTGGPDVDLTGAESSGAAFTVPDVDEETTLTFELAVSDGQGKMTTDSVNVTVEPETDGTTQTETTTGDNGEGAETQEEESETTTESTAPADDGAETETESGDGFGPGFGVVSGALGTAGGLAYAARSLLGDDDPAQPEDIAAEDIEDEE